ncbi:MAG: tetratricopeptide repeat protein [Candidatus Nealsonbacteria bacterium]|nr:tetratricopeptide repeat protein [Candidatus Nealsonbacteria bacterium]
MPANYTKSDEPIPGTGYRLTEFLGRGGFGEVWKATGPGGTEAALKIIRLGGTEGRKEFHSLQLVKRIRHPNLVPITAFWLKDADGSVLDDAYAEQEDLLTDDTGDSGSPMRGTMASLPKVSGVLAAELVIAMGLGDRSLFDRLEECRGQGLDGIPHDELFGYTEDAARAIDFLNSPVHDLGSGPAAIQHCDIKPQNMLVVGGAVQVCDFGLARMMGTDRTTSAAATVAYAAPECLEEGRPSHSTDQYSLAISYFELKTGTLPFAEETLQAVMSAKKSGTLDFSRLPEAEAAVLSHATVRDPKQRYQSAVEMVDALRLAVGGETETEKLAPWALKATARRRGGPTLTTAALLAILAAAVCLAAWKSGFFDRQPPVESRDDRAERAKLAAGYLASGTKFLESKDYDRAATDLTLAAEYAPGDVRALSRLGAARMQQQNWEAAAAALTRAVAIDPKDPGNERDLIRLSDAYSELNKFTEAAAALGRAVQLNPHNAEAHYSQAHCYQRDEAYAQAVAAFGKAIDNYVEYSRSATPTFALEDAYIARAACHIQEEQFDEAAADFDRVLAMEPLGLAGNRPLLEILAAYYEKAGQAEEAARWLKEAEKAGRS